MKILEVMTGDIVPLKILIEVLKDLLPEANISFVSTKSIKNKKSEIVFDMYEIDSHIKLLDGIEKGKVIYGDFMQQEITKTYKTIVGNPPFVRTKKGNLYIDFTEKCFNLLEDNGELIFIVPSDFFKLTEWSP